MEEPGAGGCSGLTSVGGRARCEVSQRTHRAIFIIAFSAFSRNATLRPWSLPPRYSRLPVETKACVADLGPVPKHRQHIRAARRKRETVALIGIALDNV